MQTLNLDEQEMVAGGGTMWRYELEPIFDREAMVGGLKKSAITGAVGGAAGGATIGFIGVLPGALFGASIGAAAWIIGGSFTSFPTRVPVITIQELGTNSSASSRMGGDSDCW